MSSQSSKISFQRLKILILSKTRLKIWHAFLMKYYMLIIHYRLLQNLDKGGHFGKQNGFHKHENLAIFKKLVYTKRRMVGL